ncbi:GNAT family N-acetyltransferase [Brevibacterium aurantiacum]|uniref:GNAT family N-acetyltransferase n=1 Tax=Brevibacterium aurantiacum TaxID=273384 RepID=UPI00164237CC|nr:GNAT family N-acetyltransferase [Brevibacterium aurantiacum]
MSFVIRPPVIDDVEAVAQVHVETWRETYRGLMSDELLDSPDMMGKRRRMWSSLIAPENHPDHTSAIADQDGVIVGIALSGPSAAEDRPGERQLFVLYAYAAVHGSGIGQQLLERSRRSRGANFSVGGRPESACSSFLPKKRLRLRRCCRNR